MSGKHVGGLQDSLSIRAKKRLIKTVTRIGLSSNHCCWENVGDDPSLTQWGRITAVLRNVIWLPQPGIEKRCIKHDQHVIFILIHDYLTLLTSAEKLFIRARFEYMANISWAIESLLTIKWARNTSEESEKHEQVWSSNLALRRLDSTVFLLTFV